MRTVHWAWLHHYRPRDMDRLVNAELQIAERPPGEHDVRMAQRVLRRKRAYQRERARHEQGRTDR